MFSNILHSKFIEIRSWSASLRCYYCCSAHSHAEIWIRHFSDHAYFEPTVWWHDQSIAMWLDMQHRTICGVELLHLACGACQPTHLNFINNYNTNDDGTLAIYCDIGSWLFSATNWLSNAVFLSSKCVPQTQFSAVIQWDHLMEIKTLSKVLRRRSATCTLLILIDALP